MEEIRMIGVFPGKLVKADSVQSFIDRYSLKLETVLLDPENMIVNEYVATRTPEVLLIDRKGGILYRGRIDDWAYDTGRKKPVPTTNDLFDAISELVEKGIVNVQDTEPVGCFIE